MMKIEGRAEEFLRKLIAMAASVPCVANGKGEVIGTPEQIAQVGTFSEYARGTMLSLEEIAAAPGTRADAFDAMVVAERARQDAKWGVKSADQLTAYHWVSILAEEAGEAVQAINHVAEGKGTVEAAVAELVQTAAVCRRMYERRGVERAEEARAREVLARARIDAPIGARVAVQDPKDALTAYASARFDAEVASSHRADAQVDVAFKALSLSVEQASEESARVRRALWCVREWGAMLDERGGYRSMEVDPARSAVFCGLTDCVASAAIERVARTRGWKTGDRSKLLGCDGIAETLLYLPGEYALPHADHFFLMPDDYAWVKGGYDDDVRARATNIAMRRDWIWRTAARIADSAKILPGEVFAEMLPDDVEAAPWSAK